MLNGQNVHKHSVPVWGKMGRGNSAFMLGTLVRYELKCLPSKGIFES
jgi:hypothetical protein